MTTSEVHLGWENNHERQYLWGQLESWQYKVFIESFKSHHTLFQFEVVVSDNSSLNGLKVTGNIEIPLEILYPAEEERPPDNHGTLDLIDERCDSFIGVTLLVSPESFAELFRVFSAAFGNNSSPGLQLYLKHPKGGEPNFWRTGWQHEEIQVNHFHLYSGGDIKKSSRFD